MPAGTQGSYQSGNAVCVLIPQGVGRRFFKATQPGYHYSTDQGESRIWGNTTPAPVSYLVAHKRPAAAMSWRPQGKNYIQEKSAKSSGYTMYLDESATSVSQLRRGARAYRPLVAPRRDDLGWGPEPEVICNPQPLTLTTLSRPVEDVARLDTNMEVVVGSKLCFSPLFFFFFCGSGRRLCRRLHDKSDRGDGLPSSRSDRSVEWRPIAWHRLFSRTLPTVTRRNLV